ncbi:MAG: P1 family peptidase [Calditrichia bacterium]
MEKQFKIGHYTNTPQGTGCTVVLCPKGTRASGYARGAAPGTREYALLSPQRKIEAIDAVLISGGSAFGLEAAGGVMRFLWEQGRGYPTPFGRIPIVPAAVIYDLYTKDSRAYPAADDAYQACKEAKSGNDARGTIGAGTGATVGKWAGFEYMMTAGLGRARIDLKSLYVDVLTVVNPVGDVVDTDGTILAGARKEGKFLAQENPEIRWQPPEVGFGVNTVVVVLMTNGELSKLQLHYLAERAHNGIVRAVVPAHTSYDGDMVFALTTGEVPVEIDLITEMGVEAVRRAIINGVQSSE